ncbi:MAG: hypothetical protein ABI557_04385, partial [Aureliella sp.]
LVGAYGSSTAITPALDRMASEGVLLDQCFLDSQQLHEQLRSLWTGAHALQTGPLPWNLWQSFAARWGSSSSAAVSARLLTDSPQVAELAEQMGCPQITLIEPRTASPSVQLPTGDLDRDRLEGPVHAPAEDSSQCAVMELLATAVSELASGPPGLIWIHSRGLRHAWDAPLAMRAQFADPEDPEPPSEVELPSTAIDAETDPDFVVGWGQVAAAQAAVIDEGLSALRDTVAHRSDSTAWSWLFSTLGGVPLGEHGHMGWGHSQMFGSELHTATIVVPAQSLPIGLRRPELFQLPDIGATLAGLLELDLPATVWGQNALELGASQSPDRWPREFRLAMLAGTLHSWLRTPAWSAVLSNEELNNDDAQSDSYTEQLFVKPEDRWEVSQIADRRRDIVELHRQLLPLFATAAQRGQRSALPVLVDDLLNLLR